VVVAYAPELLGAECDLPVLEYLRAAGTDARQAQIMATEMGLTGDRLRLAAGAPSGGGQRRLTIAGALAGGAHALFPDEPTLDLDFAGREALCAWLPTLKAAVRSRRTTRFS